MNKYSVGVVGATGYAGVELLRLLARHPGVELVAAVSSGRGAQPALPISALAPGWTGRTDLVCAPAGISDFGRVGADFVFLATPHETSMEWVSGLFGFSKPPRVIDLSGAFRFHDAAVFERWYGMPHAAPQFLSRAVYGWPEKHRDAIRKADLVANPGCYATAASTALWPLLSAGAIESDGIVCDAKSGASGAGRGLRDELHFVELEGNCKAYGVYTHRHTPEIAEQSGLAATEFTFTPHLLPCSRGILATTYVRLRPNGAAPTETIEAAYRRAYSRSGADSGMVRICGEQLPDLNRVVYSNFCDVGYQIHPGGRRAVIVSCLDNLGKGAAGQAVQNFNLMTGWPESTALL